MFFKRFKEKSNQKYINKLLSERSGSVKQGDIQTVGVLLNTDEYYDVEAIHTFFKSLDIQQARTRIVAFVADEKASRELWGAYYSPKHIGWNGKINHPELQLFVDTNYDMLLCFYREPHMELDVIAAQSKAEFKVGISPRDLRFFDLTIDVETNQFKLFTSELTKYLNVLNKL